MGVRNSTKLHYLQTPIGRDNMYLQCSFLAGFHAPWVKLFWYVIDPALMINLHEKEKKLDPPFPRFWWGSRIISNMINSHHFTKEKRGKNPKFRPNSVLALLKLNYK